MKFVISHVSFRESFEIFADLALGPRFIDEILYCLEKPKISLNGSFQAKNLGILPNQTPPHCFSVMGKIHIEKYLNVF